MRLLAETVIQVGGRNTPLSLLQVQEVLQELQLHHPEVEFDVEAVETTGDLDQKTSLRSLDKTDFFTKEIDAMLLNGECRIAIHSAKDLPDPLPEGLAIIALTKGVSSADALVLREGEVLRENMLIATSSERREESVQMLNPNVEFCDIRGNIKQRLAQLENGSVDGVVIAEAALIRLGLTHLNRIILPGETAALQGRLAVVARSDDQEIAALFSCIDTRKKCLYLGMELPKQPLDTIYTHYPVITTIPRDPQRPEIQEAFKEIPEYTHIIFTSKSGVRTFFNILSSTNETVNHVRTIAVGEKTAEEAMKHGLNNVLIAENETAEGVTELLETIDSKNAYFFWPHSALSRNIITSFLKTKGIKYRDCALYDTITFQPKPPPKLEDFHAIFFTSPSTVKAFLAIYKQIPNDKEIKCIGSITKEAVELYRSLQ